MKFNVLLGFVPYKLNYHDLFFFIFLVEVVFFSLVIYSDD